MLPLFSAPFDASGNLLVSTRVGIADLADAHPQSPPYTSSSRPSAAGAGKAERGLEIAAWAAFARGLGLARESVFDIIRAIGLDPGIARAVADQVAATGKAAGEVATGTTPAPQGAKLALVFNGVSVRLAGAHGQLSVKVDEVSIKASLGAGTGDQGPGFGEARVTIAGANENLSVNADNAGLQARFAELGVSLNAEVPASQLSASPAGGGPGPGLRFSRPHRPRGQLGAAHLTRGRLDRALPLAARRAAAPVA